MRLLLDEMYPAALAEALRDTGIDAVTVAAAGLAGRSDLDVFDAAVDDGRAILTENVSDFTRIADQRVADGHGHAGLLVALSSRFSRRPTGRAGLVVAIRAVAVESLVDRTVYLIRVIDQPD